MPERFGLRLACWWMVGLLAVCVIGWGSESSWAQTDAAAEPTAVSEESTNKLPSPEKSKRDKLLDSNVGKAIERFSYAAIIVVLVLCGLGLPLPEEVPILTSAILAASGTLHPWWALGSLMVGIMLGDSVIYWLGRRWGSHVLEHRFAKRMLPPERRDKIAGYFDKYGAWIIFFGRFLPGLRAPLFLTAGTMRVSFWTFCGMNGAAAIISVPTSFGLAYYFTHQLEQALAVRDSVQYWAFGGLAVFVVGGLLAKRWWVRRQSHNAARSGETMSPSDR